MSVGIYSHFYYQLLTIIQLFPCLVLCRFPLLSFNLQTVYTAIKLDETNAGSIFQFSCLKHYFQCLLNTEFIAFVVALRRTPEDFEKFWFNVWCKRKNYVNYVEHQMLENSCIILEQITWKQSLALLKLFLI